MSLVLLGILNQQLAGGGAANAYDLLETIIVSGTPTSVDFTNLGAYSTEYKHLQVRYNARANNGGYGSQYLNMRLNGNTGSSYAWHWMRGTGGSPGTEGASSQSFMVGGWLKGSSGILGSTAVGVIDILDAYSTSRTRTIRSLSGLAGSGINNIVIAGGLFNNTGTVSAISLFPEGGSLLENGSRFSLYGMRAE